MNTKLPDFVIADLYKNTLVITGNDVHTDASQQVTPGVQVTKNEVLNPPQTVPAVQKKWFLGDNKKGIVIVARDTEAVFINDEWLETLSKMLGGLQINLGDTAIVNMHNNPVTFTDIKEQLQARHVIMFGVTTQQLQLPFTVPDYQVQNYAGCTLVGAPVTTLASAAYSTDAIKVEKRKLWESLKRMNL
jgi:hypothetical protein